MYDTNVMCRRRRQLFVYAIIIHAEMYQKLLLQEIGWKYYNLQV